MNINCQPPLQFVYFSTDTHIPWISHNTLRDRLFKNGVAIRKKVYCIWGKAPKVTFARRTLEVTVAIQFNEGGNGRLQVFSNCGIAPGHFTIQGYAKFDQARIKLMNRKATPKCKQDRKRKRAQREGWQDKESTEEKSYGRGAF